MFRRVPMAGTTATMTLCLTRPDIPGLPTVLYISTGVQQHFVSTPPNSIRPQPRAHPPQLYKNPIHTLIPPKPSHFFNLAPIHTITTPPRFRLTCLMPQCLSTYWPPIFPPMDPISTTTFQQVGGGSHAPTWIYVIQHRGVQHRQSHNYSYS